MWFLLNQNWHLNGHYLKSWVSIDSVGDTLWSILLFLLMNSYNFLLISQVFLLLVLSFKPFHALSFPCEERMPHNQLRLSTQSCTASIYLNWNVTYFRTEGTQLSIIGDVLCLVKSFIKQRTILRGQNLFRKDYLRVYRMISWALGIYKMKVTLQADCMKELL